MPLSRAEQYYHALLRRQGWRTYAPADSVDQQLEEIRRLEEEDASADPFASPPADLAALWTRWEGQQ